MPSKVLKPACEPNPFISSFDFGLATPTPRKAFAAAAPSLKAKKTKEKKRRKNRLKQTDKEIERKKERRRETARERTGRKPSDK